MEDKLIRPDYIKRDAEKVHYLSDAARRHYADVFWQYGQPLPLPETRTAFDAAMWNILDLQLNEIVSELHAALPNMSAAERSAGYWNPTIRRLLCRPDSPRR
jgi:hypothetical protein